MFTLLEQIVQHQAAVQDTLSQVLGIVKCQAVGAAKDNTILPEGIRLPLNSVADIESLEQILQDSASLSGLVCKYMCVIC